MSRNFEEDCKAVFRFSQYMEYKLASNSHKKHWSKCKTSYLLRRLKQEITELEEAIIDGRPALDVILEAADVANFAMMIADNWRNDEQKGQ